MISNEYKAERFRLASTHGPVTVTYDSQVSGVVQPAPRSREPAQWVFGADALVTAEAVRTPTDTPLVHVPWAAVIAVTLEQQGARYFLDEDVDARRLAHGKHLRLVKGAA